MKKFLLTFSLFLSVIAAHAQCTVIRIPLAQKASASNDIFEGKVISKYSYWNAAHNMIYTVNTLEVYKVFKGNLTASRIGIITEGGTVGLNRIQVEPSLELGIGDEGLFTCVPANQLHIPAQTRNMEYYEVYASVQGFVKYAKDGSASDGFDRFADIQADVYNVVAAPGPNQYREIQVREVPQQNRNQGPQQIMAGPDVQGFSPTTLTAGTDQILTIDGEFFGATQGAGYVEFPNADDGGMTMIQPLATDYIFWDDFQIKVRVPHNAGTGFFNVEQGGTGTSPSELTISYAHLNVEFDPGPGMESYGTDHVNDNGSGGYTWRMNTGFDADAAAKASFLRAFDTWRCNTSVNWTIGATTSINDAVSDGTNIICYDNTSPLSAGVLGVCYSYWSGCASGPNIVWYVSELDIIFDEGSNIAPLTWEFGPAAPSGSEYDFETVAVHELGHGHQLGHVIAPGAIMHYAIANGTSNRSLGVDDEAGGDFVQSKSVVANLCGPGAMSNYSCGTPPVAAFTGTPLTICAGETVNFTDQSTGTPTSWTWTLTGGTPSSSSSQNPSIVYNTPGTYAVTLNVSNGSGSDAHTELAYITVNPAPSVSASSSPSPATVCAGQSVTLNGSGASSYVWTGGVTDGVPFTPASTLTYTVTGTDGNGCTATATVPVTVNSLPVISVVSNPSNGIVCSGNQATLTASGAQSYSWTGGITNGVAFTPASTTTYTVTGTAATGCTGTAQSTITVQNCALPTTTVPCGGTYYNMVQTISAVNVPGAVNYRFTFYDNVSLAQVAQRTQNSRTLTFSNVTGLTYNATYRITVAVDAGSGFGAESNIGCTVTFGVPQPVVPCGVSFNSLNSLVYATNTPGAVNYRFTFYDNVSLVQVAQRTQPSRTLVFGTVTGLNNNNTYRYTVAIEYNLVGGGTAFGPESPITCTVSFGGPTSTLPCGNTYTNMAGAVTAPSVYGALNYRFTFYDNVSLAQVAQRTQTSNVLVFSNVSGINYGNTYRWTVAVEYNNGTANVYGAESSNACTVTFGAPTTVVPCNGVYNFNGFASATARVGATGYRFRFYQGPSLMGELTQVSRTLYFSNVPGISAGQAYTWTVEVQYNNGSGLVFGPASTPCNITFNTSARFAGNDDEPLITAPESFSTSMYPNPLSDHRNPFVTINGADGEVAHINVFDLNGRLITTYEFYVEGHTFTVELNGFPSLESGMYLMEVVAGEQRSVTKFIAE